MIHEHLLQEKVLYVSKDNLSPEKEEPASSDTENLPISDILRFMTHEKFILTGFLILGIGKFLIILGIFY